MRQPYRNLFGSCLLAALILPSVPSVAAPLLDTSAGRPADPHATGQAEANQVGADPAVAGIRDPGKVPGGASDGLQEGVTAGHLASFTREPVLGRLPAPVAANGAANGNEGAIRPVPPAATQAAAHAALMASAAQAAPIGESPANPGAPSFSLPPPGSATPGIAAPGNGAPPSGFAAPRPAIPETLAKALTALSEKKIDDAIRLARTFISEADAKGPGPESTPPTMALAHEIVGTGLAVQNKPDEAIAELKKALTYNPNQASALFKLGVIYREQGKLPDAKANLEKAVALGGGDAVKLYLGDINERMGDVPGALKIYEAMLPNARPDDVKFKIHVAALYDRVNRFADAIKLLEPIVTADSKDADGLMALGFAYGGSGKPKEAIPLLMAAKLLAPDNWRVDLALGTAHREVGEFDAAEISLKRVVESQPKLVQARFQLALVQMAKSQFADAIVNLTEAEKLAPNAPEIKQLLGDALFRTGKKDEAVAVFKELAARDGATLNDSVNLARAYQAVGRLDDAVQVYRDAIQKFPPNPGVYALLGVVQAQQKKFDDARATIADARKTTPDDARLLRALIEVEMAAGNPKAALTVSQHLVDTQPKSLADRYTLAILYDKTGDRKRSMSIYQGMLADAPDNAVVLNNLAVMMTDEGDAKGAVPLARKAVALQPASSAVNDTLGWALLKSGNAKEALPLLELATKTEPTNPELFYHLALAQKALNSPKEARANLEKALSMSPSFSGSADAKAVLAKLPK